MTTDNHTPRTIEIQLLHNHIAIIDEQDADLIPPVKWRPTTKRSGVYATRIVKPYIKRRGTSQYLHRMIAERILGRELAEKEHVDHINGDTLDNRRCNLRVCSHKNNIRNSKLSAANKTGYKGVMVIKGAYVAKITIDAKSINLGRFVSAIDAAIAYNQAAVKHFGEFARLNPVDGWETATPQKIGRKQPKKRVSKPFYTRVRTYGKTWTVLISVKGKTHSVGGFTTEEEARDYEAKYCLENAA